MRGLKAPLKVVSLELSEPLSDLEGLAGYNGIYAIVRLNGRPVGDFTLPVTDGRCTADALRHAIDGKTYWRVAHRIIADALHGSKLHGSKWFDEHSDDASSGAARDYPLRGGAHSATICSDARGNDPAHRLASAYTALGGGPPAPQSSARGVAEPLLSVVVCTRDRPDDLALCVQHLERLDYPSLELIVVDNAPKTDGAERLLRERHPRVRYLREPRPGLDWARNRGVIEARGEIVAFTDDDVVVDAGWARAIAAAFVDAPDVMAVTGLVVPYEIETEAQRLFEVYGGFNRGYMRAWYRKDRHDPHSYASHGAGRFGTGANMAFRRAVFERIGLFDPALDVGTVTNGGGDLEMYFRVLKEGHTLAYEAAALVFHRHRRDEATLARQIATWGVGTVSYAVRSIRHYPEELRAFLGLGGWMLRHWAKRIVGALRGTNEIPPRLVLGEALGALPGLMRYGQARRRALEIERTFGPQPALEPTREMSPRSAEPSTSPTRLRPAITPVATGVRPAEAIAVRSIDVSKPAEPVRDVCDYACTRLYFFLHDVPLGFREIRNEYAAIGAAQLAETIATVMLEKHGVYDRLTLPVAMRGEGAGRAAEAGGPPPRVHDSSSADERRHHSMADAITPPHLPAPLSRLFCDSRQPATPRPAALPSHVSVSVVVATLDRPDDLRRCLRNLFAQNTARRVEIVVVDNNPSSRLTPPVVAEFPGVVLVREPRRGLAYARNAGFLASTGDILVSTDDDVVMPPMWLERLVAPFASESVMIVTGNVLPLELDTRAQQLFEGYGGLGRGFTQFDVGRDWFDSYRRDAVPTWDLGATANAAFRASIFAHPGIGLMDEALGPGMPSGVGEDTYLFYKVLRAGYRLWYEPTAFVWHRHRRDMRALRRQLWAYSTGHVAYHLTTWLRDRDARALWRLAVTLPRAHLWCIKARFQRRYGLSIPLILHGIRGSLAGAWALWRSRRRVAREGRSGVYVPPAGRTAGAVASRTSAAA